MYSAYRAASVGAVRQEERERRTGNRVAPLSTSVAIATARTNDDDDDGPPTPRLDRQLSSWVGIGRNQRTPVGLSVALGVGTPQVIFCCCEVV